MHIYVYTVAICVCMREINDRTINCKVLVPKSKSTFAPGKKKNTEVSEAKESDRCTAKVRQKAMFFFSPKFLRPKFVDKWRQLRKSMHQMKPSKPSKPSKPTKNSTTVETEKQGKELTENDIEVHRSIGWPWRTSSTYKHYLKKYGKWKMAKNQQQYVNKCSWVKE